MAKGETTMELPRTQRVRTPVHVCLTVDVEEEGLFSGSYPAHPASPASPAHLRRLIPLCRDHRLPLTLFCTYPVIQDPKSREIVAWWQGEMGAELGIHLHPWNTPPLTPDDGEDPRFPRIERLEAKLATQTRSHRELLGCTASSFRMGRFDFRPEFGGLLPRYGLRVDSSLLPLGWSKNGPHRFLVPYEPHFLGPGFLEVPPTMTPIVPGSELFVEKIAQWSPRIIRSLLLEGFRTIAAAGTQPTMYFGPIMRLAANLHLSRGGRFLTLYLHSSELMPGGSPLSRDLAAVDRLVDRLRRFFDGLATHHLLHGVTLSQVGECLEDRCTVGPQGVSQ